MKVTLHLPQHGWVIADDDNIIKVSKDVNVTILNGTLDEVSKNLLDLAEGIRNPSLVTTEADYPHDDSDYSFSNYSELHCVLTGDVEANEQEIKIIQAAIKKENEKRAKESVRRTEEERKAAVRKEAADLRTYNRLKKKFEKK